MRLVEFPAGGTLFLDANILIYHVAGTYPSCALLLIRAQRRELRLVTSTAILLEVRHRLMMLEAAQSFSRPQRQVLSFLKRHPDLIRGLSKSRLAFDRLTALRIRLLPVTHRLVMEAHRLGSELGLLTNDALLVATMRTHRLVHLASNDRDFTRVPGITLWRP